jgi:microsomal epoxide hydrolase
MARLYDGAPFRIEVPDSELSDLRARLERTRWPVEPKAAPWRFGTSLAYMHEVVAYWRDAYDWRKAEAEINRFNNYLIPVGGKKLHVLIEEGSGAHPMPLILTAGWPGNFVEYIDMIEPLAHPERFGGRPEDAFTVICPSMPGYAFSEPPDAPITPRDIGQLWHELATQALGLTRYALHGSDWGAAVASWLAFDHPAEVAALHLTVPLMRTKDTELTRPFDAEELQYFQELTVKMRREAGYQAIHGTKPLTLAYGLTDSPAGLAAWILEKFQVWSSAFGTTANPPMSLDRMLTNVMLYWLNGPGPASWNYVSMLEGDAFLLPAGGRIETPTGLFLCAGDISHPSPPQMAGRSYNVVERRLVDHGSHFPGFDAAEALTESLRDFCRAYRGG